MNALSTLEYMLINLGFAALIAGDLDESKPTFAEALRIAQRIDDRVARYYALGGLGSHAARSGQARLAAELPGAAETIRIGTGARLNAILAQVLAQAQESAIAALGIPKFEAESAAGKRLSRDEAFGLALGLSVPPAAGAGASQYAEPGLLRPREIEVARLVADGLTIKQIGARLFISERTVENHVRSVTNKLGV